MQFLVIAALAFALTTPGAFAAESCHGPVAVAISAEGSTLYVTEQLAARVSYVNAKTGAVEGWIEVGEAPWGLALSPDYALAYVTDAVADGKVHVIDLSAREVIKSFAVGHTPSAVAVSPDGGTIYVCNRFDNAVGIYDAATGEAIGETGVVREPVAAALTPDGARLVVANLLPSGAADEDYVAAQVSVVDTAARSVFASVRLPNGSSGLRGVCISPDGKYAYVAHVLGRYQLPTTQLERGWMNTNALSVIDVKAGVLVNTVLLDDVDLGAANPWGVACTADGKRLCVSHAGTHEISVIDREALHGKLARAAAGERVSDVTSSAEDVVNDLAFLVDLRRRLPLKGNGPRGIAVAGNKLFAAEHFSDAVGCVELTTARRDAANSFPLGAGGEMTAERHGKMLFHDAKMCFQQWQSCVSCHPDARADGLNWDLLNDGIGNPKNTKSLLLSHQTPPVMSRGVRDRAETAVRAGMKYIQFTVRPEEDAEAIDAFLKSMEPAPAPAELDEEATKRGEAVFNFAGCVNCHPAPLYTDMQKYNLGMGLYGDEGEAFDTPTLVEVWRTAPYLHDGRAASIRDVLTVHNLNDRHGKTSELTEQELADLEAYVLTR